MIKTNCVLVFLSLKNRISLSISQPATVHKRCLDCFVYLVCSVFHIKMHLMTHSCPLFQYLYMSSVCILMSSIYLHFNFATGCKLPVILYYEIISICHTIHDLTYPSILSIMLILNYPRNHVLSESVSLNLLLSPISFYQPDRACKMAYFLY